MGSVMVDLEVGIPSITRGVEVVEDGEIISSIIIREENAIG